MARAEAIFGGLGELDSGFANGAPGASRGDRWEDAARSELAHTAATGWPAYMIAVWNNFVRGGVSPGPITSTTSGMARAVAALKWAMVPRTARERTITAWSMPGRWMSAV